MTDVCKKNYLKKLGQADGKKFNFTVRLSSSSHQQLQTTYQNSAKNEEIFENLVKNEEISKLA